MKIMSIIKFLQSAFKGKEKLWKIYWLLTILPRLIFTIVFLTIFFTIFPQSSLYYSLSTYFMVSLVVVQWLLLWDNSFNSQKKIYGYLVRGQCLAEFLLVTKLAGFF